MNTGRNTPQGFLPIEPSIDEIMKRIGGPGFSAQTEASKPVDTAAVKASEDMKRNCVAVFSSPAGQQVLEWLFDQSLRRSHSHPNPEAGFEQEALYSRERKGQNGIVVMLLKMIHDGQQLPAPGSRKRKRAA